MALAAACIPIGLIAACQEDDLEPATQVCHYCREACETDLLSGEPVFQCVWCQAVAHVRCHQDTHPSEDTKPDSKTASARRGSRGSAERHNGPDGASDDGRTDVEGASDGGYSTVDTAGGGADGGIFSPTTDGGSEFSEDGGLAAAAARAMRWQGFGLLSPDGSGSRTEVEAGGGRTESRGPAENGPGHKENGRFQNGKHSAASATTWLVGGKGANAIQSVANHARSLVTKLNDDFEQAEGVLAVA